MLWRYSSIDSSVYFIRRLRFFLMEHTRVVDYKDIVIHMSCLSTQRSS